MGVLKGVIFTLARGAPEERRCSVKTAVVGTAPY